MHASLQQKWLHLIYQFVIYFVPIERICHYHFYCDFSLRSLCKLEMVCKRMTNVEVL